VICVLVVAAGAPWESTALGLLVDDPGVVVLKRRVVRRTEIARRHRRRTGVGDAVERFGERRDDARAGQL